MTLLAQISEEAFNAQEPFQMLFRFLLIRALLVFLPRSCNLSLDLT